MNEDTLAMVTDLKDKISEMAGGRNFEKFEPHSYKTQVVAGTNYDIKIVVADAECVHVKVFKALPHEQAPPAVNAVQCGKSLEDNL